MEPRRTPGTGGVKYGVNKEPLSSSHLGDKMYKNGAAIFHLNYNNENGEKRL